MKYEDYEKILNGIVANPDTAPTAIQSVLAEIKTDTEALQSATTTIADQDKRIKDLQDTNIKLFMSQTGTVEDDPEPKEKSFEELVKEKMEEK